MLGGRDPYPSVNAVQAGEHLRPAPRPRTTLKQTSGWSLPYPSRPAGGAAPPVPRPITPASGGGSPYGGSAADALRRAFSAAGRNDIAWIALGMAGLAWVLRLGFWLDWLTAGLERLADLVLFTSLLLGFGGWFVSLDAVRPGRGRRPALAALGLCLLYWLI
jgi:hypothetical protein